MKNILTGQFITLEGVEGVGKTTNINILKSVLTQLEIPFITTREPGGTSIAEEIRQLLLTKKTEELQPISELLLIFAGRAQHINTVINPALASGKWVICDRFTDATYAYQGGGRHIDIEKISILEAWIQGNLQPNLTFLLDLPVDEGLRRAAKRGTPDRFETEKTSFFESIRAAYLKRAAAMPKRFKIIDASHPIEVVHKMIEQKFLQFIQETVRSES